jgi:TldD protein
VFSDPDHVALAATAIESALAAGASYADVRIARYHSQSVSTREARVTSVSDREHSGFGVRVVSDGAWGFAASPIVTREEVLRVAAEAVAVAKANGPLMKERVELAPVDVHVDIWRSPIRTDPFEIPVAQKVELLLELNAAALAVPEVSFCQSSMSFDREHKLFASSDGSRIEQTLYRCNPWFSVTSVKQGSGFRSCNGLRSPMALGWEYMEDVPWLDEARQVAEWAVEKHGARGVEPGKRDLILLPSHLWLTIHESIGHPTELDRALGLEANYAGTSFLTTDKLGTFKLGSDLVNIEAEKTAPGSLATCGYDDDGARTLNWNLVEKGVFVDYQTTRDQAAWIGRERGYATSYAQSWKDVAFQRMPNINLVPPPDGPTLAALIADTEDAILIAGRGSYSIDHQRYNFQFGGQTFHHVKDGEVGEMLADVAYQANTSDFWAACDAICGPDAYEVGGSYYDGKGEPGQSNAVSHGTSPARFRQIDVINTRREV